jgi:hypothetical protein
MSAENQKSEVSKKAVWAGRIISALPILFLIMDGVMKLFKPAVVVDATVKLGWAGEGHRNSGRDPSDFRCSLSDSADIIPRRDLVDRLSRWRGRDSGARGRATFLERLVSDLPRRDVVVGTLLA